MQENTNNTTTELNDNDLEKVSGGLSLESTLSLASRRLANSSSGFMCPCDTCGVDTVWYYDADSENFVCSGCGAKKSKLWYEDNKLRTTAVF